MTDSPLNTFLEAISRASRNPCFNSDIGLREVSGFSLEDTRDAAHKGETMNHHREKWAIRRVCP